MKNALSKLFLPLIDRMERENRAFKELISSSDIEIVTQSEIHKIIVTREPKGRFIVFEISGWLGLRIKKWREHNDM